MSINYLTATTCDYDAAARRAAISPQLRDNRRFRARRLQSFLAALTVWGQAEDRRRTAEARFDHHLVNPPEPKAVEELLARFLKHQ